MATELKVPSVGESITEVQIGEWLKSEGDPVARDDVLVTIETDKATVELPAPEDGVLSKVLKKDGEDATVGEVIGYLEAGEAPAKKSEKGAKGGKKQRQKKKEKRQESSNGDGGAPARGDGVERRASPVALRLLEEHGLSPDDVEGSGRGGRLLKEDVLREIERRRADDGESETAAESEPETETATATATETDTRTATEPVTQTTTATDGRHRREEVVPMSPIRRRIAERLVKSTQEAALLTTFNEVDMSAIIELRNRYRDRFLERYEIKLGFMSFFVKAAIDALKQFPQVNAEIRGTDIVYHDYFDIGIAVGGGKGLVVPVLRNAERMSFAEIELAINDFAARAKKNALKLEELRGGTFTISNGGVYGSMLSTPIINPPQSGILGLHRIEDRPVARDGQVVIRPMMYLALTYDHRIVDGREAVTFLVRIREAIEEPSRMLLEV